MNTLPPELLLPILLHLPRSSLAHCRLVCTTFNNLTFPILFSHIPQWLDYDISHRKIMSLAQDAFNRPAVMWSPFASEPDRELEDAWLHVVFKIICWRNAPGSGPGRLVELGSGDEDGEVERLTGDNFAALSGKADMTAKKLRTAQNRYLLHKDYANMF